MRRLLLVAAAAACLLGCIPAMVGGAAGRHAANERTRELLIASGSIEDQGARAIGLTIEEDLSISAVEPGGPSAKAGILAGDRLSLVHGRPVVNRQAAWNELFVLTKESISVTVNRSGKRIWFWVKPRPIKASPSAP